MVLQAQVPAAADSSQDPASPPASVPQRSAGAPPVAVPARRSPNSLGLPFLKNLAQDQKEIWTSPLQVRLRDVRWLAPLAAASAFAFASDQDVARHFSRSSPSSLNRSQQFSDVGLATLLVGAGGTYLWGKATHDEHRRETGLLSGEAVLNATAFSFAVKAAADRQRPFQGSGAGTFFGGGMSFPSEHAAAAWSAASVVAHEYPGPLTQALAYGAAIAISAARVAAHQHFPSDVVVGSAAGWLIGRHVYRAHHDPELEGASWGTFEPTAEYLPDPANMGSPYVALDTWVYPAFDRLAAWGYSPTAMAGLRPWTRMECARLLQQAKSLMDEDTLDAASEPNRLYDALQREFAPEIARRGGARNRGARIESLYTRFTGISGLPLTDGYHFGQLLINDYGRPYSDGVNLVSGLSASATAGPMAFYFRGEYQHSPAAPVFSDPVRQAIAAADKTPVPPPGSGLDINRFRVLEAYLSWTWHDIQVSFGKQALWWGPARGSALNFSNNAEPIPMLRLTRVTPFRMPLPLRLMGPLRMEMFFGWLGGHQFIQLRDSQGVVVADIAGAIRPRPYIQGTKLSFKPTPNLEFGFSETAVFGGPGPGFGLSWHTFLRSFSPGGNTVPGSPGDPGDRRTGFDFTYRIPGLRKWLVLYNDSMAEDEFNPIAYPRRSAMNPGLYMPQVPGIAKLELRAEAVYTDLPGLQDSGFFYGNNHYKSGYTNYGNIMGSWVGREGKGLQFSGTYWVSATNKVEVAYRKQAVNPEFFLGTLHKFGGRTEWMLRPDLGFVGSLKYDRWYFPVLSSGKQSNVVASFQLTWRPPWALH